MHIRSRAPRLFPLCLILGLLALGGCATAKREAQTPPAAEIAQRIEALEAGRDYHSAAQAYLALADTVPPPARYQYQTRAAELLLLHGDPEAAKALLGQLYPRNDLPADLRFRLDLVNARIALAEGRAEETLRLLQQPPAALAPDLQGEVFALRAQAFLAVNNPLESVRERLLLEPFLKDEAARQENHELIWQALSSLSAEALNQLASATRPGVLAGWLELVAVIKGMQDRPAEMELRLAQWREQYPGHPAEEMLVRLLTGGETLPMPEQPADVALLLPLSGQYAGPAAAVRDGFLAAYYAQPDGRPRPAVRIYDTHGNPADTLAQYQDAVGQGVRLVVGPLDKEGLLSLMQAGQLPVPVLALNTVESDAPAVPNLYQFGLLPEDELYQAAERAWMDGHHRALVLAPRGAWGTRLAGGFRKYWEQLGGTVLEAQTYDPEDSDFSEPIRALLDIDEAQARQRDLRNLLQRKIAFEPRRRPDADFVFLVGFPQQTRLLQPQLRFHRAADLPIYATSHVYAGLPGNAADRDLDGILFCDIPWLLSDGGSPTGRARLEKLWPEALRRYPRLYALGMDAYNVAPYLTQMRDNPYSRFAGATGALSLDPANNHLRRELAWARFVDGRPRVLEQTARPPVSISSRSPD